MLKTMVLMIAVAFNARGMEMTDVVSMAEAQNSWSMVILFCVSVLLLLLVVALLFWNIRLIKFQKIVSQIPMQLGVCDLKGQILYYQNENLAHEETMPRTLSEMPVEIQMVFKEVIPKILSTGEHQTKELDLYRSRRKLEFYPLSSELFGRKAILWQSQDVTALTQALADRTLTVQRFERTLSSIGDAVVTTNFDGEVTLMNPAAERVSGYKSEECLGKKFDSFFSFRLASGDSPVMEVIERGREKVITGDMHFQNNEWRHVEGSITPIMDTQNLVIGTVFCFRDTTDMVQQKQVLQTALEYAQTTDRARSDFLVKLNHEVRGSVNSIIGYSQLLAMNHVSLQQSSEFKKIQAESYQLLDIMNGMLDMSKLDEADLQLNIGAMDIKIMGIELQRIFQRTADIRHVPLVVKYHMELPLFTCDYKAVRQILMHIISLSYALTDEAEIVLLPIWVRPVLKLEVKVKLKVTEIQADALVVQKLAVTRQLAMRIGGTLEVHFDNKFMISVLSFSHLDSREQEKKLEVIPEFPVQTDLEKRDCVLLVDDFPVNLKVMQDQLKRLGMVAVCCESANSALNEMRKYIPKIVITDLWMPEIGGDELARIIRQDPQLRTIPLVLVTGDNQLDDDIKALFDVIVYKPVQLGRLMDILTQYNLISQIEGEQHG